MTAPANHSPKSHIHRTGRTNLRFYPETFATDAVQVHVANVFHLSFNAFASVLEQHIVNPAATFQQHKFPVYLESTVFILV
ncbi:MAG: hypothetical protein U5K79_08345 [Cyclobacteriaceae bacterium]|nr:hypothetical protein [Cyclobacteriaceae bacterium]